MGYADGVGTAAAFNQPSGVSLDASGKFALVVGFHLAPARLVDSV